MKTWKLEITLKDHGSPVYTKEFIEKELQGMFNRHTVDCYWNVDNVTEVTDARETQTQNDRK